MDSWGGSDGTSLIRILKPLRVLQGRLITCKMDTHLVSTVIDHLLCAWLWGSRGDQAEPAIRELAVQSHSCPCLTSSFPGQQDSCVQGAAGGQSGCKPHGQGLAHGESTGLFLAESREDGVCLAFFLLDSRKSWAPSSGVTSCQQPSQPPPSGFVHALCSQPRGLPALLGG